jgi:hypothetical protein
VTLLLGCVSVASAAMDVDLFVHKDKFGMLIRSNIIAKNVTVYANIRHQIMALWNDFDIDYYYIMLQERA